MAATDGNSPVPDFITFLFSEKPKFDCHFVVGEETLVKPERFGAVKMMLMAHSVVFRTELEDSELREKNDIAVKDMYPDTFRTLLKFIYGHDTTGELDFEEADNMFYAAEKYLMSHLKNKLAVRLMALLTPQNVCSLLNNPAISTHLELKAHVTQILRHETDKVLASPQFVEVCLEGFVSILEQDGLAVPEIELWRAALKWARHRANSEDGKDLRQRLSGVSKHLRICTLTGDQFCQEVVPTHVLNSNEVEQVAISIGEKGKVEALKEFSNELEPRKMLQNETKLLSEIIQRPTSWSFIELKPTEHCEEVATWKEDCSFTIITKFLTVELLPLICFALDRKSKDRKGSTYKVNFSIKITKFSSDDIVLIPVLDREFRQKVRWGKPFEIPFALAGNNVKLRPSSKYKIKIGFGLIGLPIVTYKSNGSHVYRNEHMTLVFTAAAPSNYLRYRVVNK